MDPFKEDSDGLSCLELAGERGLTSVVERIIRSDRTRALEVMEKAAKRKKAELAAAQRAKLKAEYEKKKSSNAANVLDDFRNEKNEG